MRLIHLRNNVGFSLIELIISIGILGIFLYILSTFTVYMFIENHKIQIKLDYYNLSSQIMAAMKNDASCKGNLVNNGAIFPAATTMANLKIYNSAGAAVSTVIPNFTGPVSPGSGIRVTGISIVNITTLQPNKDYVFDLSIAATHTSGAMTSQKPITIQGIHVRTDSSGNVVSCQSQTKLLCATGFLKASGYATNFASSSDMEIRVKSDANYGLAFSDVFTVYQNTASTKWGLACNQPSWALTNCTSSGLNSGPGIAPTTINDDYGSVDGVHPSSCLSRASAIPASPGPNIGLYLTCCSTF